MSQTRYEQASTALLLVDPYNDFLSDGGIAWPRLKDVAEDVGLLDNLRAIHAAARAAGIRISSCRTISGNRAITTGGFTSTRRSRRS